MHTTSRPLSALHIHHSEDARSLAPLDMLSLNSRKSDGGRGVWGEIWGHGAPHVGGNEVAQPPRKLTGAEPRFLTAMSAPGAVNADLCEGQLLARPRENGVAHAAVFEPEVSVAAGEVRGALARGGGGIAEAEDVQDPERSQDHVPRPAERGRRVGAPFESVSLAARKARRRRAGNTTDRRDESGYGAEALQGWHRQFGAAHLAHTADPRRRDVCGFADEHQRRATGVASGDGVWCGVTRLARVRALGPGVGRARHFGGCLGLPNIKYAALSEPSKFTFPAAQLSAEDNVRDVLTHEYGGRSVRGAPGVQCAR
ncbi:hypothetical protein DFH09DRAFT_1102409 [Mycena vulgaris]|nr:hypothetical protein DFH09DRAFT_1102409 [Mycena vulgaris]